MLDLHNCYLIDNVIRSMYDIWLKDNTRKCKGRTYQFYGMFITRIEELESVFGMWIRLFKVQRKSGFHQGRCVAHLSGKLFN